MTSHTMLEHLELRNYRRFEAIDIDFEPDLTVIVAANGGGKTAILDAIAIAAASVVDELRQAQNHGFSATDVRLAQAPTGAMVALTPTTLRCTATLAGDKTAWNRELGSVAGRTTTAGTKEIKERASALLAALQHFAAGKSDAPPLLPLVAYYGTGRLWSSHRATKRKAGTAKDRTLQTHAYLDALSPSSSYAQFVVWFESIVREAQNEKETRVASPHAPQEALKAVREAVDVVLRPSGWGGLDWDFVTGEVIALHATQGRLRVDLLSDGVRNLIALVADLAHRAVRLNPHLRGAACRLSPGIVLIDEVDMHLHPSWQQTIVGLFREAFPHVQFVLTTHSPFVVSTVPSRSIRMLHDDGMVETPATETEGYDGSFALHTVFAVDNAPPGDVADKLRSLSRLIEDGDGATDAASDLRSELLAHFGEHHPAIMATKALQRLQDFKARKAGGAR